MTLRRALLPAALLLGLAGCAAPEATAPAPEPVADATPAGVETARVLALRPLGTGGAGRERVAPQLLVLAVAQPEPGGELAIEVLVRVERTGRDVALVHPAEPRLRVGDRVRVTWEPRPRLQRLEGG
ncbi:MAG: hypothetical protein MUF65_07995 [Rubritepida sp.]|jgi:hypothetical protein|nr:hypothetical protein [Rubritepida sp.]MCU0945296.1 hypothetical protein [Rubritepida sp.]